MIDYYKINLSYGTDKAFRSNPGYHIYACLMGMLPDDLCEAMHENVKTPVSQNIEYNNTDGTAVWCISSFDEELSEILNGLLDRCKEFPIERDGIVLRSESIKKTHIRGFNDIRKISSDISVNRDITLQFRTTTALKKNGEFLVFPDLDLMIENLWKQWNIVFPNNSFEDEDALSLIKHQTSISSYNLSSSFYKMKGCGIRGFYGKLTVTNRLSAPLRELLAALFTFAEFNGTGVKNALGMGKTKILR